MRNIRMKEEKFAAGMILDQKRSIFQINRSPLQVHASQKKLSPPSTIISSKINSKFKLVDIFKSQRESFNSTQTLDPKKTNK